MGSRNQNSDEGKGDSVRQDRVRGGGNSSDSFKDDRVTVSSFEERSDLRRERADYSTSRSRKNRRRQEKGNGKALWLTVVAIVGAYLALLAFHTVTKSPYVEIPADPSVETGTSESAVEADGLSGPLLPPSDYVADIVPVSNLIIDISRAMQLSREGRSLMRNNRYAAAQEKMRSAVLLAPNIYETLIDYSKVLLEQKEDLLAREILLRAVSVDPDSVDARMMLAKTLFRLKEYENALVTALWVLETQPYSESAHQVAADVYTVQENHAAAIRHWEKIAALNSGNHAARNSLGSALLLEGQVSQAISTFESVIRDDPGNSQAHYYLAICFIRKEEPELAVSVLANAATRLGIQFVKAWAKSPEFDSLRELPSFQRQFSSDGVATEVPVKIETSL